MTKPARQRRKPDRTTKRQERSIRRKRMRAVLCRSLGDIAALEVAEVASPALGAGQVRISVRASGVNFPDILMTEGKYQVKPDLPFTPGLEVAGVVLECAPGVDHVRPGDRVIAF